MYLGEILLQNISGFICLPFNGGGGNSYCLFNFIQTNLHKQIIKGKKYLFDFYFFFILLFYFSGSIFLE